MQRVFSILYFILYYILYFIFLVNEVKESRKNINSSMLCADEVLTRLVHFSPVSHFYTPWKRQKTKGLKWVNTCDEQQFYIAKMMMLIFSVIVMCSYLYSVCLVSWVLKNTYLKEHLSVIASKYSICDTEKKTWNLHYVQCLNIAPTKKAWFMAPVDKE